MNNEQGRPIAAPRYVGVCGAPGAGKSTLAEMMVRRYGARLIDDGLCLRLAVMELYGLPWEAVSTQKGKAQTVEVCGKSYTVRQLLGDLGNLLEGFYGEQFMPERALWNARVACDDRHPFYVFPSVRKRQGQVYRDAGGIIVEVSRPGYEPVNDFDHYDREMVGLIVLNDDGGPRWKKTLERRMARLLDPIFLFPCGGKGAAS